MLFFSAWAELQDRDRPPSAVWQENTQIRPEEMMTRSMWRELEKKLSEPWCVSGASGHGGWRCSLFGPYRLQSSRETTRTEPVWRQDSTASFTLQKPQHKEHREQRNLRVRPGCTLTSLTKYGLPPAIFGNVRHAGVFIKPGILIEGSWLSSSSSWLHLSTKHQPEIKSCYCLLSLMTSFTKILHKSLKTSSRPGSP